MAQHSPYTDQQLLEWCNAESTPEVLEYLRAAAKLLEVKGRDRHPAAVVMLVVAMARCSDWAIPDSTVQMHGRYAMREPWVERKDLSAVLTQFGGLIAGRSFVALTAETAISQAIREHWLCETDYDSWRPGMGSGTGLKDVVRAQPLGFARATELFDSIAAVANEASDDSKRIAATIDSPPIIGQARQDEDPNEGDVLRLREFNSAAQEQPEPPLDKTWLSRMVMCAYSLRDLRLANYNYPDAIAKKEFDSIEKDLSSWIEIGLEQPGFEKFRDLFDANDDPTNLILSTALIMHHPDFDTADESTLNRLMKACEAAEIGEAEKPVQRVLEIRLWNCLVPKPSTDESYSEPKRHLRLIDLYWQALKPIIHCEMNAFLVYTSHPLMKWIINLRQRVDICFAEIKDVEGAVACQEDFDCVVSALLDDPDMLQCGVEIVQRQIRNVDRFLAEATVTLSLGGTNLTREESDFLKVFNKYAGVHIEQVELGKANAKKLIEKEIEERRANKKEATSTKPGSSTEVVAPQTIRESPKPTSAVEKPRPSARISIDKLQLAIQFIKGHPKAKALTIAKHLGVKEATFRSNYMPALNDHGVRNDGDGYYIPNS